MDKFNVEKIELKGEIENLEEMNKDYKDTIKTLK